MSEVVDLKPNTTANRETLEADRLLSEARTLAKLALMSTLQYERERLAAAKELGCRPATLDKMVEQTRAAVQSFAAECSGVSDRWSVGAKIHFSDCDAIGIVLASGCSWDKRSDRCLVLVADGNGTLKQGSLPVKDPK